MISSTHNCPPGSLTEEIAFIPFASRVHSILKTLA